MAEGILLGMGLACHWHRSRLAPFVDGALGTRPAASVSAHLRRCQRCRKAIEEASRLRQMLRSALPPEGPPDWGGFWPGIESRIRSEPPRPIRAAWWLPLWKPVWGHPRMALGGAMAVCALLLWSIWPVAQTEAPVAWAGPVVVQDVHTSDPDGSVMVYSSPDHPTVIWVFALEGRPAGVNR